ncbi:MAG: winged helix-turn-helix domain-containing protein, partial [bacterium]
TTLRFYKNDRLIDLSSKENSMMLLFMQNPERVFTKDMIYEHVWDNTIIVDNNAIMVYINRLRNKIEDNPQKPVYIQTVRGVGYRFSVS